MPIETAFSDILEAATSPAQIPSPMPLNVQTRTAWRPDRGDKSGPAKLRLAEGRTSEQARELMPPRASGDVGATVRNGRRGAGAAEIGPALLTVVVPDAHDGSALLARLGVPKARCLKLEQPHDAWPRRAMAAAKLAKSHFLVLAGDAPPDGLPLVEQLRQASREGLVACLPIPDPLVEQVEPARTSLIPGTLFRRVALLENCGDGEEESAFWTALTRTGLVGALPPAPVPRPEPRAVQAAAQPRDDRMPALAEAPETADALVRALIDPEWYVATYPDVAAAHVDPVQHYLDHGWRELREPNAWFCTRWYLARNPGVRRSGVMPLLDFATGAEHLARRPHPGFFPAWYAARHAEATDTRLALLHFLRIGAARGALPGPTLDTPEIAERLGRTPAQERSRLLLHLQAEAGIDESLAPDLVDGVWYAQRYPDVAAAGVSPVEHYLSLGWQEGRDPNAWFDSGWYLDHHPEAAAWRACPLDHLVARGGRPSPNFDAAWYGKTFLSPSTSAAASLRHYLAEGWAKGLVPDPALATPKRRARYEQCPFGDRPALAAALRDEGEQEARLLPALFDAEWYVASCPGLAPGEALAHFLAEGWREGRDPNAWFSTTFYLSQYPALETAGPSPLEHFIRVGAAAGSRPHPLFDTNWYAQRYLGRHQGSAEALHHFLRTGLAAGAVPDPAIEATAVRSWLLEQPQASRAQAIRRLLMRAQATGGGPAPWAEEDAELWPPLLRRRMPEDRMTAVLLVFAEGAGAGLARAAEAALPAEEEPVFCVVAQNGSLVLSDALGGDALAVRLHLPAQATGLRSLLAATRCRRAAWVDDGPIPGSAARAIRNAGVPLVERRTPLRCQVAA